MQNVKKIILLLGDIIFFYLALYLVMVARYNFGTYGTLFKEHFLPFSLVLVCWLLLFATSNLYDLRILKNDLRFFRTFLIADSITIMIAGALFYAFPFGVSPKTNLVLFAFFGPVLELLWRFAWNASAARRTPERVFLIGESKEITDLVAYIEQNPQLGYRIAAWERRELGAGEWRELYTRVTSERASMLVIPAMAKGDVYANEAVYACILHDIQVRDVPSFYEDVMNTTPLAELGTGWFLEELTEPHPLYDTLKRLFDFFFAALLFFILLPIMILIALIIRFDSAGPIFYTQTRVGKRGKHFMLYKFRTMRLNAEQNGAQWAQKNDPRITRVGRVLRRSHLDELPQLANIIEGNASFVGPRPERPEFVDTLKEQIPYYEIRHIVKPGVTGWAQINYRYTASAEEAYRKLEYDIFYIRRRGFVFDILIILKTLKTIFATPK